MANINDTGWFGDPRPEPRDDRIERLARESEKKSVLLRLKKCKTLVEYKELVNQLEQEVMQ